MRQYKHGATVAITRLLNWRRGKRGRIEQVSVTVVVPREDARCSRAVHEAFTNAADALGYSEVVA